MIGHHYTSERIYHRCIVCGGLNSNSVFETECGTLRGSWIFCRNLEGLSLLGTCVLHAAKHRTTRICHLEVEFTEADIHPLLRDDEDADSAYLKLSHDGGLGDWVYHTKEPALVLSEPVPPSRIKLAQCYDLMDAIRRK